MKLSALIARYGDNRVGCQYIDECADTLNMGKKGITKITFGTNQRITLEGTQMLGLILWFDRKAFADIVAADKEIAEGHEPKDSSASNERPKGT